MSDEQAKTTTPAADYPPLTDQALNALADDLFVALDQEESARSAAT